VLHVVMQQHVCCLGYVSFVLVMCSLSGLGNLSYCDVIHPHRLWDKSIDKNSRPTQILVSYFFTVSRRQLATCFDGSCCHLQAVFFARNNVEVFHRRLRFHSFHMHVHKRDALCLMKTS